MGTKVEDVTGNIGKAADAARKSSSIWGAGLAAGVKAYLEGRNERKEPGKKITASSEGVKTAKDRGEENVGYNR